MIQGHLSAFEAIATHMRNTYLGMLGVWAVATLLTWLYVKLFHRGESDA
jgi:hypothetical protein